MSTAKEELTAREVMGLKVMFFILKMINPTGYEHEINKLRKDVLGEE